MGWRRSCFRHTTDSRHLSDHETLAELAVKAGLDHDEVLKMLASTDYSAEGRADEAEAAAWRRSVPFFVIDHEHAVSGAQPSNIFIKALQTAWDESHPYRAEHAGSDSAEAVCDDGVCTPSVMRKQ